MRRLFASSCSIRKLKAASRMKSRAAAKIVVALTVELPESLEDVGGVLPCVGEACCAAGRVATGEGAGKVVLLAAANSVWKVSMVSP